MKTKTLFLILFYFLIENGIFGQTPQILIGGEPKLFHEICQGSALTMSVSPTPTGAISWRRTYDNQQVGNTQTITVVPTVSAVKYECYFIVSGVVKYASIDITINPLPVVNVLSDTLFVCDSTIATLTATNGVLPSHTYQWYENGNPLIGATSYQLQIPNTANGKLYDCKVTDAGGCSSYSRTSSGTGTLVKINPKITATFTINQTICSGDVVNLGVTINGGTAPYSATISSSGDLSQPNNVNPVVGVTAGGTATFTVAPKVTTTYHFNIKDGKGCVKNY